MLIFAAAAQPNSRLLCQIRMRTELEQYRKVSIKPSEREYAE